MKLSPVAADYRGVLRALFRSDHGASLVEVIVAMAALLTLTLGVYAGLDTASMASGRSQARTVAAALAQEDQERMRSLRVADLVNTSITSTRTVDGEPYTVRSEATFVEDASGATACSASARADFVVITSTVSSPAMGSMKPVTVQSIVAPPSGTFSTTQGSVAVTVHDGAGAGVAGVTVTLTGAGAYSQQTNAQGCALFAYIEPGNWTVGANAPGFVDNDGNQEVSRPVGVSAQTTTVTAFDYDRAAAVVTSFETRLPGAPETQPARSEALTVAHPTLAAPGTKTLPTGAPQPDEDFATINVPALFPFSSSYGFYSGTCTANDPASYSPAKPGAYLVTQPNGAHTVVVREPALDVRVEAGGEPQAGARVVFASADAGCANRLERTTGAGGRIDEPGLPYGTYNVCAEWNGRSVTVAAVENLEPEGTAVTLPDLVGGSSQSGACP